MMQQNGKPKFELTEEHIKLIGQLNFEICVDTEYDDQYIPGINRKRPFGNSGATDSVLEILGCKCDEKGNFSEEEIEHAEILLIELPLAMEIVAKNRTFEPGIYEVDRCGVYHQYKRMCNYKALRGALEEVKRTYHAEDDDNGFYQLQLFCMSVSGDDPWKVIKNIEWGVSVIPFWKNYLAVFEKHRDMAAKKAQERK